MNTDKVLALAREADGMVLAHQTLFYHANLIKFAALLQQQMIEDGWRKCAKGQVTTQFCGIAEELRDKLKYYEAPPKEIDPNKWAFDRGLESY